MKAKIQKNAEELALNGFCLAPSRDSVGDLPTVLVVEAGPKYMKFFKRLLLHRINWSQRKGNKGKKNEKEMMEIETDESDNPYIQLIWEGVVADHMFPKWFIKQIRSEAEGRKQFSDRNVEEYWDMALSRKLPELHN